MPRKKLTLPILTPTSYPQKKTKKEKKIRNNSYHDFFKYFYISKFLQLHKELGRSGAYYAYLPSATVTTPSTSFQIIDPYYFTAVQFIIQLLLKGVIFRYLHHIWKLNWERNYNNNRTVHCNEWKVLFMF